LFYQDTLVFSITDEQATDSVLAVNISHRCNEFMWQRY